MGETRSIRETRLSGETVSRGDIMSTCDTRSSGSMPCNKLLD